ncbi:MAG: FlgO family outer membrane protein [Elusimicrobiota bacterium]
MNRKKIIIFLFITAVCVNCLSAKDSAFEKKVIELSDRIHSTLQSLPAKDNKLRIAVQDFTNLNQSAKDNNIGGTVSAMLITRFVQSGYYEVVEREQLYKVIKEAEISMRGLSDPDSAKKIGKIVNADIIVLGSVSEVSESYFVNTRIIDVEKAVVIAAASTDIKIRKRVFHKDRVAQIQKNLDTLDKTIHLYSQIVSQQYLRVVWPETLSVLVPEYISELPDPLEGNWVYDNGTGQVHNSVYPDLKPATVYPKMEPVYRQVRHANIQNGLRMLDMAVKSYYANYGKYPESLDALDNYYLNRLPNPAPGRWMYDNETGEVSHKED